MKKRNFILIISLIFPLSSCGLFMEKLATPVLKSQGYYLYWDHVENATDYDIYKDGELYDSTTKNYYRALDLSETGEFHIVARAEGYKNSVRSAYKKVYKNTNFTEEETLEIDLSIESYVIIGSEYNYVSITGTAEAGRISLEYRTTDILIELNNVNFTAAEGKTCITLEGDYLYTDFDYTAIFVVNGDNYLNGSSYTSSMPQPSPNTSQDGRKGGSGKHAIYLPNVYITGDGNLTCQGGKGGVGGKGANSEGIYIGLYGKGGEGGNGGNGIYCSNLYVDFNSSKSKLVAKGGLAGEGGVPGNNGSVLSGPTGVLMWESSFGKKGSNGKSIIGTVKILNGKAEY